MNSTRITQITVNGGNQGERIDCFLAKYFKRVSRSRIKKLIENNQVTIDGVTVNASKRIREGATICVENFRDKPFEVVPEYIPFNVVSYDDHVIVVNKPSGLVVHPARKHLSGTLVNGILYRFGRLPRTGVPGRPGIVHRLDKDTSGVMVVARTEKAFNSLKDQFRGRQVKKEYIAITQGIPAFQSGVISKGIRSSETMYNRMKIAENGKKSTTEYEIISTIGNYALVRVRPLTGRTHQIRLHLRSLGTPVLCDRLYGHAGTIRLVNIPGVQEQKYNPVLLSRLALHAEKISFYHPDTQKPVAFSVPMPEEFSMFFSSVEEYV